MERGVRERLAHEPAPPVLPQRHDPVHRLLGRLPPLVGLVPRDVPPLAAVHDEEDRHFDRRLVLVVAAAIAVLPLSAAVRHASAADPQDLTRGHLHPYPVRHRTLDDVPHDVPREDLVEVAYLPPVAVGDDHVQLVAAAELHVRGRRRRPRPDEDVHLRDPPEPERPVPSPVRGEVVVGVEVGLDPRQEQPGLRAVLAGHPAPPPLLKGRRARSPLPVAEGHVDLPPFREHPRRARQEAPK
mmetsp:Transcript_34419/g.82288  ORF Transcript_34419/g.82288 Transcript_34419/m.82288 type:complete len:241 (-) Transcript_34419:97-819(-)